jgi:hypothetical protein
MRTTLAGSRAPALVFLGEMKTRVPCLSDDGHEDKGERLNLLAATSDQPNTVEAMATSASEAAPAPASLRHHRKGFCGRMDVSFGSAIAPVGGGGIIRERVRWNRCLYWLRPLSSAPSTEIVLAISNLNDQ